ncbi:MAG: adenosylcobinamide-GDP ribazoletransferase [Coriobacteriia bacterium]|nr:adenosylcobinamide-GDP ribazoletransferase [Coriobacteriia bacterium]
MRPVADMLTAVRLLTVVPIGRREGEHPARYFPLVGWLFGALAAGIASGAVALDSADGLGALLTAAVIVTAWALLSGFLHLDGLADSADGIGVRGDAGRRLEVMRDSSIGAFGVVAVVLALVLQVAAIAMIVESRSWWALAAAPVLGRFSAAAALVWRQPASSVGLAARYAERPVAVTVLVMLVPLAALLVVPPDIGRTAVVAAGVVFALVAPGPFVRRLGGITGDVLGATIVLTETAVLVACAITGGLT